MQEFAKRVSCKIAKLSREQLESVFEEISNQNSSLESIIYSMDTGLIAVDIDYHITLINKAAERYLLLTRMLDYKQKSIYVWEAIEDKNICDFLQDAYKKKACNITQEFSIATKGGNVRFLQICISSLLTCGNMTGFILCIEDLTDKKKQEIEFHRMEGLASLTTLAANMAHDIKNPLGSLSIHIQLVQKSLKKAEQNLCISEQQAFLEKHLNIVNEEIERLNKIVVDFLFAVRPLKANFEIVNVVSLLNELLDFVNPLTLEKGIKLEATLPDKAVMLMLDKVLFRQSLMNILQNAIYALENTLQNPLISIKAFCTKDLKFHIEIQDNGCGMNDTTLNHIFEPYFTTRPSGTGLGMTMVYKIIKEFSGDIEVQSKENQGTLFKIYLPIAQTKRMLISKD